MSGEFVEDRHENFYGAFKNIGNWFKNIKLDSKTSMRRSKTIMMGPKKLGMISSVIKFIVIKNIDN